MNLQLVSTIIFSALTGATLALIAERYVSPPPTFATIDPTALVTEQLRNLEPGLSDKEIQERGEQYAQRLDASITTIAKERNLIILVKPAVVTGLPDITEAIRRSTNGGR